VPGPPYHRRVIEPDDREESLFEEWDLDEDDLEPIPEPAWRRPLLIVVAAITALALAAVPIYNVLFTDTTAENGLDVCGFDYCVVQEGVRAAGLDLVMSRLANTFLTEEEARALADELTGHIGVEPVGLVVVQEIDGRIGGVYDPRTRRVTIESPARAWTVLHEVAHVVAGGHGDDFIAVVVDLAVHMNTRD